MTYFLAADFMMSDQCSSVALRALGLAIEEAVPMLECRCRETDLILLYSANPLRRPYMEDVADSLGGGRVIGYLNNGNPALFQLYLVVRAAGSGVGSSYPPSHVSSLWELADPGCCSGLIGRIREHLFGLGLLKNIHGG